MFGSCALSKGLCALAFILFFPLLTWAQAQQGTVIVDGAMVYQDADFDAPVIDTLKRGAIHSISKGKKGPFYKIRVKSGSVGWIADTDIKPGVVKLAAPKKDRKAEEEEKAKAEKKRRPFFAARYRGPTFDYINYTEDTLGAERSAGILFYGFKFNGYNTLFDGDIYTDGNLLFYFGAPNYYENYTKKSADGFIVIADFLLQTVLPQSKWHLLYYGFGPMFKYSHFNLAVPNGGTKTLNYSADDMALGAVFDLGLAFRLGSLSLRTDAKYYWEKTKYYGFGLNLGWEF